MSEREGVLILAGATASGKTELAIALAGRYDAEIVGADSRQLYRDMPVGTALPSSEQLRRVAHHCIGWLDPYERYSAARYARDAQDAIERIVARGKRAIVAGGTGFYLRALTGGTAPAPYYDEALRARLAREAGIHPPGFLYDWLRLRDPARAAALHPRDTYRVVRALEVALSTNDPAPAAPTLRSRGVPYALTFLDLPLDQLDERIARRTDRMLAEGFVEEAERIGPMAPAASALGYPAALAYLRGWIDRAELRRLLARATRRYARRQRAWFRGDPDAVWVAPGEIDAIVRERLGWREKARSR